MKGQSINNCGLLNYSFQQYFQCLPREGRTSVCFPTNCSSGLNLSGCWVVHTLDSRGRSRYIKREAVPPLPHPAPSSRCLSCVYEGEKDARDRKMLRRGAEEDRKREDGHGNEKNEFFTGRSNSTLYEARPKEIKRKQLFYIPRLKSLLYLKTLGRQIWNRQGKDQERFEKSNRSISILKTQLWFAGNAPGNQVLLWGSPPANNQKRRPAAEGP